jgi:iron complex transport system substrate-binding protein
MRAWLSYLLMASLCAAGASVVAKPSGTAPTRVVSMNLCTDQLAMMLAGDGQLLSVSYLAGDPRGSAMAQEAQNYIPNHGRAEEIYLLEPDLVIAGSYSTRATVDMLKRLDLPVAVIDPAWSLSDVSDRIVEIGALLGQEARADQLIADFDAALAEVAQPASDGPRAALYSSRGWTQGEGSLAGQILGAAGFRNIATEAGYDRGGIMPLEVLAMMQPDMVVSSAPYAGYSRSEELLLHPVIETFRQGQARANMRDADWVCGSPFVLRAIERLRADRDAFEAQTSKGGEK